MKYIELTEEKMNELGICAFIRIKDLSGFFDPEMRRLWLMYSVATNCEASIIWVEREPDLLFPLIDSRTKRRFEECGMKPFQKEVERIGSLLKKFSLLIDPEARIEIDYPEKEEVLGRRLPLAYDLFSAYREKRSEDGLSIHLAPSLEERIDSFMDLIFLPENWMMGVCHSIWELKKNILRYEFHIDWKSPAERNPHIIYD